MFALIKYSLQARSVVAGALYQQHRHLNLQEYVSQTLLNDHGITTPRFGNAKTGEEAEKIARDLLTKNLMVKAQVMAGGRGLGKFKSGLKSGVHAASCPDEIKELAGKMIGQHLVTKQTGPEGKICNSVMVAERKFSRREFYFAFALDRNFNGPVLIASRYGGVNIEEVAGDDPKAVIYEPINQEKGFTREMALWVAKRVGIKDQPGPTVKMLCNLYALFMSKDVLLAEINPYVEDVCMNYFALDAKLTFDESAEFRQGEIFAKRDKSQEDPKEVAARKHGLSYIPLDGTIGCMVNGSGLAMATLDILKFYGGEPANFLDVGGMADVNAVTNAVGIIMMDPKVRAIFVNIFAGILHCDMIVEGLMKAIKQFDIKIPIVVRLQGNKLAEGRKMIREKNISVIIRDDFSEAAETAVKCARIMSLADCADLEAALKMKVKCECDPIPPDTKPKFPPCPPTNDTANKEVKPLSTGGTIVIKPSTKSR